MGYVLTEEQGFLKDSVRDLLKAAPVSRVRELRDNGDEKAFDQNLWNKVIEMGLPSLVLGEAIGGLNFGWRSTGLVFEELGRALANTPLLSSIIASHVLEKFGSEDQKAALSEIIYQGSVVSIALQEGDFYRPNNCLSKISNDDQGLVLNGTKDMVSDLHVASHVLLNVSENEDSSIFLIPTDRAGVSVMKEFMMDSRYYSKLILENVKVEESDRLGKAGDGLLIVETITTLSNALIASELYGLSLEAFERTVDYMKERRQFDRAIGSFQALQHRAADLFGELELAKSLAIKALDAIDENDMKAPALASMAKAKCIKVSQRATNEGIQIFGGIGMTDDEEIGFFLKRARVAAQQFGNYSYHLNRFATMSGY